MPHGKFTYQQEVEGSVLFFPGFCCLSRFFFIIFLQWWFMPISAELLR